MRFVAPEWNADELSIDLDNTYEAWNCRPFVNRRVTLVSRRALIAGDG